MKRIMKRMIGALLITSFLLSSTNVYAKDNKKTKYKSFASVIASYKSKGIGVPQTTYIKAKTKYGIKRCLLINDGVEVSASTTGLYLLKNKRIYCVHKFEGYVVGMSKNKKYVMSDFGSAGMGFVISKYSNGKYHDKRIIKSTVKGYEKVKKQYKKKYHIQAVKWNS